MGQQVAKMVIFAGILLIIAGVIIYFFHNKLNWFGRLPGDVSIERENFKLYLPVVSMLLLSMFLSVIVNLIRRIF